jgi:LmbE family N-acetylglucosaminyl deacetylase
MSGKKVAVIVAHPDDETLWVGGTILNHPEWKWYIVTLCRGNDADRAPKFYQVLKTLGATGKMGDMDDGPEQLPLDDNNLRKTIIELIPDKSYDLIITHDPSGEYTRHLRHEETSRAVIQLWNDQLIYAPELWTFAYTDGNKTHPPKAVKSADIIYRLPAGLWKKKYEIITKMYGFQKNSFEAGATTRDEAFWQFSKTLDALNWLNKRQIR